MKRHPVSHFILGALNLIWGLAAFSAFLLSVFLVWSLIAGLPAPSSFALEISLSGFEIGPPDVDPSRNLVIALPVALEATGPTPSLPEFQGDYRFAVQKGWFLTASLAILLMLMLLATAIVDQLRKVFQTIESKDPFVVENAFRIRRIGWSLILMELLSAGATLYWSSSVRDAGAVAASHFRVPEILVGLLILALAEVFREGARLREEQSLTI